MPDFHVTTRPRSSWVAATPSKAARPAHHPSGSSRTRCGGRLAIYGSLVVGREVAAHRSRALAVAVLLSAACCTAVADFDYTAGSGTAALQQLATKNPYVGPQVMKLHSSYMCRVTLQHLGVTAYDQVCSDSAWYFIQGGSTSAEWRKDDEHPAGFEFCKDGRTRRPGEQSITTMYTWLTDKQQKAGLLRAPSGADLRFGRGTSGILNEALWSVLPRDGKFAACWKAESGRLDVLRNPDDGSYPDRRRTCFTLRSHQDKTDQNAYTAVRDDIAFGLMVGVYQEVWRALSASDDRNRISIRDPETCTLKPPCFRAPVGLFARLDGMFAATPASAWTAATRELAERARQTFGQHVSRAHAPQAPAPSPTPTPVPAAPFLVHRSRPDLRGLSAAVRAQARLAASSSELISLWMSLDYDDDEVRYVDTSSGPLPPLLEALKGFIATLPPERAKEVRSMLRVVQPASTAAPVVPLTSAQKADWKFLWVSARSASALPRPCPRVSPSQPFRHRPFPTEPRGPAHREARVRPVGQLG